MPSPASFKDIALATALAAGDLLAAGAQMKVNLSTDRLWTCRTR